MSAHDISVHISGENHAAMVGMGAVAFDQVIWVATEDAEEARALLRELREGGEGALADDEVPSDDDTADRDDEAPGGALVTSGTDTLTRLGARKRIALALLAGLCLTFGTAHLSTRAWKRGIALAAMELVGWMRYAAGQTTLGGALIGAAIVLDVVGAIWHVTRPPRSIAPAIALRRG